MNLWSAPNSGIALKIKGFVLIFGIIIIGATVLSVINHNWQFLTYFQPVLKAIIKIIGFGLPYLISLIASSITVLWLPIAIYLFISIITTSPWWRFFLCLVALCSLFLFIQLVVLSNLGISLSTGIQLLVYLTDIYLLLLWTVPREIWNFTGGVLWFLQSAIIIVLPDLPSNLDDFGLIFAIFAFIFFYLHTIASLVQRFVDSKVALFVNNTLYKFIRKFFKMEATDTQ